MSKWSPEPDPRGADHAAPGALEDATGGSLNSVLVVGRSRVTRVVVCKIVEKAGLRPMSESPESAERMLAGRHPAVVILDGGSDNRDCNQLLDPIAARRRLSPQKIPRVVLLSTRNGTPESLSLGPTVDAVVAKPITPEFLQPVIDRLIAGLRG
jgi:CheY-like chemotaxis protein